MTDVKPDPIPCLWDSLDDKPTPRFRKELREGRFDRDISAQHALSSLAIVEWKARASTAIETLAQAGKPFTVDAVVEKAGLPNGEIGVNVNNAIGAMFLSAMKRGLIWTTGRRVATTRRSNHGRLVAEWVGDPFDVADPWQAAEMFASVLRSLPIDEADPMVKEWWIEEVAPVLSRYERMLKRHR